MRRLIFLLILLSLRLAAADAPAPSASSAGVRVGPNPSAVRFFEERIRPVLVEHCQACHGGGKRHGGLSINSLETFMAGGHEGIGFVPGDPGQGLLMPALRWEGDSDLNMPPKKKLPEAVIADFRRWIEIGAPWPDAQAPEMAVSTQPAPPFLGRLHPALVHLPIAALVLALLAELLGLRWGAWRWDAARWLCLLTAVASGVLALVSGLALEGGQDPRLLARHELLAWLTLAAATASAACYGLGLRRPALRIAGRVLLVAGVLLVGFTGHAGNALVRGEGWLW